MSDHDDLLADLLDIHHDTYVPDKVERKDIQRAPFGYLGGKSRSIEFLNKHIPYRRKWIDHFCGSGVVTFNRQESNFEVMNDRYGGIIAFYRCLQSKDKYKQLMERVDLTMHAREEFYHCKATWCTEVDDVERAAKWFYLFRGSMLGKGQAFGRQTDSKFTNPIISSIPLFEPVHYRLQNVLLENLDFETCFNDYDSPDAVHYCDPPYIGTDPGIYEHSWTVDDLSRLLRCICNAHGFVALSGYPNELIDSQTFWTKRLEHKVPLKAEAKAYLPENNKEHMGDIKGAQDTVTEILWIKE